MPRPEIPVAVKRAVRTNSGFGCIICGNLITDYEHIVPYAECNEHVSDNIVLLCTKHHREVTSRRMSKDKVRQAAALPFMLRNSNVGHYSIDTSRAYAISVGGNYFEFLGRCKGLHLVCFKDEPIFSVYFDEGIPQFSFVLTNPLGEVVVRVERNILSYSSKLWDVELKGKYLRAWYRNKVQILKIKLERSELTFEKLAILKEAVLAIMHVSYTTIHTPDDNVYKYRGNHYATIDEQSLPIFISFGGTHSASVYFGVPPEGHFTEEQYTSLVSAPMIGPREPGRRLEPGEVGPGAVGQRLRQNR